MFSGHLSTFRKRIFKLLPALLGIYALISGFVYAETDTLKLEDEIKEAAQIRNQLAEQVRETSSWLPSMWERAGDARNLRNFLKSQFETETSALEKVRAELRAIEENLARIRALGDLAAAWQEYIKGGKTREGFKKLYYCFYGRRPDNATLDQYDIHEQIIHKGIINKAAGPIGKALVEIGKIVIKMASFSRELVLSRKFIAPESVIKQAYARLSSPHPFAAILGKAGKMQFFLDPGKLRKILNPASTAMKVLGYSTNVAQWLNTGQKSAPQVLKALEIPLEMTDMILVETGIGSYCLGKLANAFPKKKAESLAEQLFQEAQRDSLGTLNPRKREEELREELNLLLKLAPELESKLEKTRDALTKSEKDLFELEDGINNFVNIIKAYEQALQEINQLIYDKNLSLKIAMDNAANAKKGSTSGSIVKLELDRTPTVLPANEETANAMGLLTHKSAVTVTALYQDPVTNSIRVKLMNTDTGALREVVKRVSSFIDSGSAINPQGVTFRTKPAIASGNISQGYIWGIAPGTAAAWVETRGITEWQGTKESWGPGENALEQWATQFKPKMGTVKSTEWNLSVVELKSVKWMDEHGSSNVSDDIHFFHIANPYTETLDSRLATVAIKSVGKYTDGRNFFEEPIESRILGNGAPDFMIQSEGIMNASRKGCWSITAPAYDSSGDIYLGVPLLNGNLAKKVRFSVKSGIITPELHISDSNGSDFERYQLPIGTTGIIRFVCRGSADPNRLKVEWKDVSYPGMELGPIGSFERTSNGWVMQRSIRFTSAALQAFLSKPEGGELPSAYQAAILLSRPDDASDKIECSIPVFPVVCATKFDLCDARSWKILAGFDLYAPAPMRIWERKLGVLCQLQDGTRLKLPMDLFDVKITPGAVGIKPDGTISPHVTGQNISIGESQAIPLTITVSLPKNKTLANFMTLHKPDLLPLRTIITLNLFLVGIIPDGENGAGSHRIRLLGSGPGKGMKARWIFKSGDTMETFFNSLPQGWVSDLKVDDTPEKIIVFDGLGKEAAQIDVSRQLLLSAGTVSLSIDIPGSIAANGKLRVGITAKNSHDLHFKEPRCIISIDRTHAGTFSPAQAIFKATNWNEMRAETDFSAPHTVPPEGLTVPYTVKMLVGGRTGSPGPERIVAEVKGEIRVRGTQDHEAVLSPGQYTWSVKIERVNPLSGNNPIDVINPIATIATVLQKPVRPQSGPAQPDNPTPPDETPTQPEEPTTEPLQPPLQAGASITFTKQGENFFAHIMLDSITGIGRLSNLMNEQPTCALIFQAPWRPSGWALRKTVATYNFFSNPPVWDLVSVLPTPESNPNDPSDNDKILDPDTQYTFRLKMRGGTREVEITARIVETIAGWDVNFPPSGGLRLDVINSRTISASRRAMRGVWK